MRDGYEIIIFGRGISMLPEAYASKSSDSRPVVLHNIISHRIDRRKIFCAGIDRIDFIERLGKVWAETQSPCYAWALSLII